MAWPGFFSTLNSHKLFIFTYVNNMIDNCSHPAIVLFIKGWEQHFDKAFPVGEMVGFSFRHYIGNKENCLKQKKALQLH